MIEIIRNSIIFAIVAGLIPMVISVIIVEKKESKTKLIT